MKIILSGAMKDLFKNKIFNPEWYQALGAGWELGKGKSQHDNFRSKSTRMLGQYLQQNPNEADQYYGRSHGGMGFNQIQKYLQLVNQQAAQRANYSIQAIQYMLGQQGGLQHLQQLGIIPQEQQRQTQPQQQPKVDPNIQV